MLLQNLLYLIWEPTLMGSCLQTVDVLPDQTEVLLERGTWRHQTNETEHTIGSREYVDPTKFEWGEFSGTIGVFDRTNLTHQLHLSQIQNEIDSKICARLNAQVLKPVRRRKTSA